MAREPVGGSRAVETFLRNFEGEKARYQEILEITLCYGVQCLARTFSLKGISCNELRAITDYDVARNRDFYVRNASQSTVKEAAERQRTPVELRAKPSHSWRDGEVEMPDFPQPSTVVKGGSRTAKEGAAARTGTEGGSLYSLPPAFDEIDFQTKLLGKPMVDLAWKVFAGKQGAQISTQQELEERFLRLDQRKTATIIPALELPVASFADFLSAYVVECVREIQQTGRRREEQVDVNQGDATFNGQIESVYGRERAADTSRSEGRDQRGRSVSIPRATTSNTRNSNAGVGTMQRPLHPQPQQRQPQQVPRSLQHVQSKIQPELDARRQKVLRVKKTQSQRMAETLARARLAEYDARRELQDVRDRRLGPKKMPISELTKGAAALEIVDDFMKSPLMDKFGREGSGGIAQPRPAPEKKGSTQKDPLKEELYGTAALDTSFLGCKPAPELRRRSESQPKQSKRNYNGWLGDFGPLHTKTVRPEWDEADDDAAASEPRIGDTRFEWNFDDIPSQHRKSGDHQISFDSQTHFEGGRSYDRTKRETDDYDDHLSDELSTDSDPVFRWLKDAV